MNINKASGLYTKLKIDKLENKANLRDLKAATGL